MFGINRPIYRQPQKRQPIPKKEESPKIYFYQKKKPKQS